MRLAGYRYGTLTPRSLGSLWYVLFVQVLGGFIVVAGPSQVVYILAGVFYALNRGKRGPSKVPAAAFLYPVEGGTLAIFGGRLVTHKSGLGSLRLPRYASQRFLSPRQGETLAILRQKSC